MGGWRVDIRALEAFCRACETGSFSRACEDVFISRQALSRTIQTLEREVGSPLFVRCAGGVQPTELARMIEPHARRILDEYEAIKADISRYEQGLSGTLTLAIEPNAVMTLPTGVLGAYRSARPGISLNLVTSSGASALDSLASGEVDGVVSIPMYDDSFKYASVLREPLCVVIHGEHMNGTHTMSASAGPAPESALSQLNGTVLCGVAREHPIEAQICDYLARHGVFVTMCYDYPSAMLALEAARAGLGGCIMTAAAARGFAAGDGLTVVQLDEPGEDEASPEPPQWEVGVTYRRDSSKTPMIDDLVAYLRTASHADGV